MHRFGIVAGGFLILLPTAWGGGDSQKIAADVKTVIANYQKAVLDYQKVLLGAKTQEDRKEALKKAPKTTEYSAKIWNLIEKDVKEPFAIEGLVFLVTSAGTTAEGKQAVDPLLQHHFKNPGIVTALERLAGNQDPRMEKFLRDVMEHNPSREAKGIATYSLAKRFLTRSERDRSLQPPMVTELQTMAEKLLEVVSSEYANIKSLNTTLGERAKDDLFVVRHLLPGKVIPEITGEDTDGKAFKLSDYRGKVVLLDFWGHW